MNKIFCLGDGYAHGHIWPEWPQILQALLPEVTVEIISAVGAGNEFLVSELLARDVTGSMVIFQWPEPSRFDKLLTDSSWDPIIDNDSVYYFNRCQGKTGTWWCSSASETDDVRKYHKHYINADQHKLREHVLKTLVSAFLEQQNCQWMYTSTRDQHTYSSASRFKDTRGSEVQPSPIVHFHFLIERILPILKIEVDRTWQSTLQDRIESQNWIAFDQNRYDIWRAMKSQF